MCKTLTPLGPPIVALSMHEYHGSMIGASTSFGSKKVPIMLGAPFFYVDVITTAIAAHVPAALNVWMTEFQLKDDGEARGVATP